MQRRARGRQFGGIALLYLVSVVILVAGALSVTIAAGLSGSSAPFAVGGLICAALGLIGVPGVGIWLTRYRSEWRLTKAAALALLISGGYVLLAALMRVFFPSFGEPTLHGEGTELAGLWLIVSVGYVVLVATVVPRLIPTSPQSLWARLGLDTWHWPTLALGAALVALVTLPWPLTGALGDSLTTLSIAFQTFAWALPQVLIFWGVLFGLLCGTGVRPWIGALGVVLIHGVASVAVALLPDGRWRALPGTLLLVPLAVLLTELRVRGGGVYPVLGLMWGYRFAYWAFVDPRDALAQGIPEPQHIFGQISAAVIAGLLALGLWVGRRLWTLAKRRRVSYPRTRSTWRRIAVWLLTVGCAWGLWGALYVVAGWPGFANDGFLIILEEQADLSSAYTIGDRYARLEYVYRTLVETAERTQAPLRRELETLGVPYRPYYLINMIRVDGHRWLMRRFIGRTGVARVMLNPNVREYPHRISVPYGPDTAASVPSDLPPNLVAIRADRAWKLGITGEGIVVAGQDTGYDWTHPALKAHYRGWNGERVDHNYNWHDAWDGRTEPFDADGHGTHTMGIVLGSVGEEVIGVAPGAQWIGCRNMRRGFGNPAAYVECMEFFLAPYPLGGDPFRDGRVEMAPHIVNNSWGCPEFEGCLADTLRPAVEALRAAGIMMVVSAGNDGPACGTVKDPPALYDAVLTVGATDVEGRIAGFSSRGPAGDLLKPDLVAPGAWVRSSVPGGGYGYAGGTSMAAPHVSGVIALMWSANPRLLGDIAATEALLCQTAVPKFVEEPCSLRMNRPGSRWDALISNPVCACGGVTGTPNHLYGCGLVDAEAAVRAALGH